MKRKSKKARISNIIAFTATVLQNGIKRTKLQSARLKTIKPGWNPFKSYLQDEVNSEKETEDSEDIHEF